MGQLAFTVNLKIQLFVAPCVLVHLEQTFIWRTGILKDSLEILTQTIVINPSISLVFIPFSGKLVQDSKVLQPKFVEVPCPTILLSPH